MNPDLSLFELQADVGVVIQTVCTISIFIATIFTSLLWKKTLEK